MGARLAVVAKHFADNSGGSFCSAALAGSRRIEFANASGNFLRYVANLGTSNQGCEWASSTGGDSDAASTSQFAPLGLGTERSKENDI